MKKSELRNIIKESIKELINEQGTGPFDWDAASQNITYVPAGTGRRTFVQPCNPNFGPFTQSYPSFACVTVDGQTPQVGDIVKAIAGTGGPNASYSVGDAVRITTVEPCGGQWSDGNQDTILVDFESDSSPACTALNNSLGTTGSAAPACAEIEAEDCTNPAMGMTQPCVTIDGQVPDQSYVGTAVEANNKAYLINSVSPSTSAPFGTVDLPQTGVQGCPGQGTFGIQTGGAGFNYPQGWDAGNWTNNFVNMILNHPNPCNFLNTQMNNFLNTLFAGVTTGNVGFDINGNITPPVSALSVGVLQANLLMQKIVVIYELLGMVGCLGSSLEEQRVDKSSIKNIKMDPKAKDVLRKSADKLKGLANKKANPAVDRMQKLAGIPTDKPIDKPEEK
jgi:hypothetical protein